MIQCIVLSLDCVKFDLSEENLFSEELRLQAHRKKKLSDMF